VSGLAFYQGGAYPSSFNGGLFFSDYSRDCIWFMPQGANGRPNTAAVQKFVEGAINPVYLAIGPGGDLFYADFDGGTIHRVTFASGNQAPTAVAGATPTSGTSPLAVSFTSTGSFDPEGGPLTYGWDLDGDGTDDATTASAGFTYLNAGTYVARLRVTDNGGLSDTDTVTIIVDNTAPVASITSPDPSLTFAVGDVIAFSGGATDAEDGTLAASRLSWAIVQHHCPVNPNDCHTHTVQTIPGVASGTITAPDHDYPSWLELVLTATDSGGLTSTASVRLDPKTAVLSFATVPTGLQLSVGATTSTAPFQRTVIQGSRTTLTAPAQQTLGGTTYNFQSWSDGGARSHDVFPTADTSYTATYVAAPPPADVRVTQSSQLSLPQVRFTAVVTNLGPGTATGVVLTDVLSTKLGFVSATSTAGTCSWAPGSRTITCTIGTLASGAQATVTIDATDNGKGNVPNVVNVTTTSTDPNTVNNSATVNVKLR
jgi:uncharacterized repeat protein (TIGR01451 family)